MEQVLIMLYAITKPWHTHLKQLGEVRKEERDLAAS